MTRLEIAARILAGWCAEPNRWSGLDENDCIEALKIAQALIDEDKKMGAGSGEKND